MRCFGTSTYNRQHLPVAHVTYCVEVVVGLTCHLPNKTDRCAVGLEPIAQPITLGEAACRGCELSFTDRALTLNTADISE